MAEPNDFQPQNPQTGDGKTNRDIYDKPRIDAYLDNDGNKIKRTQDKK